MPAPIRTQPDDSSHDETPEEHVHRWRIDEPGGAQSAGRCSCGVERAFQNGWEGDGANKLGSSSWLTARRRGAATES